MWAHLAALSCGLLGTAWHCLVCLARPGFPTNSASTLPKRPLAQAVARVSCLGRQVWLVWSGHQCTVLWRGIVMQSVCFCWPTLLEGRMQLLLFLLLSFLSFNNACSTVGGPAADQVLVSYPTRWSLYSSLDFCVDHLSWQWRPHIAGCKMFLTLLRAELAVLTHFFAKCISGICEEGKNPKMGCFFHFFPPQNGLESWPTTVFQK